MNLDIILPIITAVFGWTIGYYLTIRKSRLDKKRDISTENMIRIYRIICDKLHRETGNDLIKEFEHISTDLQLFGTKRQIKFVKEIIRSIVEHDEIIDFEELINDIRTHLRKELYLEKLEINNNIKYLRFTPDSESIVKMKQELDTKK